MDLHTLQVLAVNFGGVATGAMFACGMRRTHRALFALNTALLVINTVRLVYSHAHGQAHAL